MITLGIETSCDETAVAILDGTKVLADVVASSAETHAEYGGVVPEIASRQHLETILPCLRRALKSTALDLSKIDLIAVTQGPGLMGSLLVGVAAAQALGAALNKPVIPVDHVMAHAYSCQLARRRPAFPFMALVVSGGHTLLIYWKSLGEAKIIGRTHDDAAGEAFDKVAKMLDLGYPGGPVIDRLSRSADPSAYNFPRPLIRDKNYHFSFSGLKTAVLYKLRDIKSQRPVKDKDKADIAASFQEAACDVLVHKSLEACVEYKVPALFVAGGVSANTRLKKLLTAEAAKRGLKLEIVFPTARLAADNAVMIAALGAAEYNGHKRKRTSASARQDLEPYSDFFIQKKELFV